MAITKVFLETEQIWHLNHFMFLYYVVFLLKVNCQIQDTPTWKSVFTVIEIYMYQG